ncbi:hypothetical protein ACLB2K_043607 [Fragaria x ananassa]
MMIKELPVVSRDLEVHVKGVREKPKETPTILFWNCCRLGPSAIYMLKVLKAMYEPPIIFLIDTRMSSKAIKEVSSKLGFYNVYACSSTIGAVDKPNCVGLAMLFKTDVDVEFLDKTENYLDFVINVSPTGKKWRLTGFYGHPTVKARSWEWLRKLKDIKDLPWIIFGDFNEILSKDEKSGGRQKKDEKWQAFEEVRKECFLHDLPFEGCKSTWQRCNIKQRLDRGLATVEWKDMFQSYTVVHLTHGGVSDHIPIVIQTDGQKHKKKNINALRIAMDEVFSFVKQLQAYYFDMEGLQTISKIVNNTQLSIKHPEFCFQIARMIAPQVIHATDIVVHDKTTDMVKYDRLVSFKTCVNLPLVLWNCLVLAKPSSDDDFEAPPDCPSACCTQIIIENEVNLSDNLAQACKLLSLIAARGRITGQEIIDEKIDEQVKSLITWLKDSFRQGDDKKFVISIGDAEYLAKSRKLKESALVVGRAVILYNIMTSLIREKEIKCRGYITDLREKLDVKIKDYVRGNILDKEKGETTCFLEEPLQYLLKTLKLQVADSSEYEVDINADLGLEVETKVMMWTKAEPLVDEIRKRGSVQIEKLEEVVKDSVIIDRQLTVQYQIKLLTDLKILRLDVNGNLEFQEANKSSDLIVKRLEQAAHVALKSIENSTSKKPMKFQTYKNKITRAYKKSQ